VGCRPCSSSSGSVSCRQRLAVMAAGTPATGTFTMVSPTSHHGQWSRASFKIGGEERQFPSQLTQDQKSKVSGLAPRYLYHRGKLKRPFRTHAWDNARCVVCLGLFAIQTAQHPTCCKWGLNPHVNNIDPPGKREATWKVSHHYKRSVWPLFIDEVTPTS
jgi:hypothetical protein